MKKPAFQGFKVEQCETVEHAQQVRACTGGEEGGWGGLHPSREAQSAVAGLSLTCNVMTVPWDNSAMS